MRTRRSKSSNDPVSSGPKTLVHRSPSTAKTSMGHTPVLLQETIALLSLKSDDVVVDATLGGAGHARAIAKCLGAKGVFVGVDADSDAVRRAREALADVTAPTVALIEGNFRELARMLSEQKILSIDKALFDLGWSSYQLQAGRGFSFLSDEPLRMTYAHDQGVNAEVVVNEWSEETLADIIYGFGEERFARRIARRIVEARERKHIDTARELGEVIRSAVPATYARHRIHPATKTFQAIRIAVNDELGALDQGLRAAWEHMAAGGRIAVITFHSLEDRLVKRLFLSWEQVADGKRITKKPLTPSAEEIQENPRARSAKLRVVEKIKHA